MNKELFNDGAITLNLDKAVHQSNDKTFLIIGQARAGTTLVASLLHETGIPIGKNFGPVHEDNDLGKFVGDLRDSRLPKAFLDEIEDRNQAHSRWGWKRPDLYLVVNQLLKALRNPHLICIFRDFISVGRRNQISLDGSQPEVLSPEDSLETVLHEQKNILGEVRRAGVPSLLLSYEKAVTASESFLDKLLFFIGTNPKEANREKLKALISPNNIGYSLRARAKEYESSNGSGVILGVSKGAVHGFVHLPEERDTDGGALEVRIDGVVVFGEVEILSIVEGKMKYSIDLSEHLMKPTHEIGLFMKTNGKPLQNSPFIWHRG